MRESAVEAALHRAVKEAGGQSFKLIPSVKGMPDRLVLFPGGQVHLVELKATGGRLSPAQRLWHTRAAALGTTVHVLTGPDEVRRWVNHYTEGTDT